MLDLWNCLSNATEQVTLVGVLPLHVASASTLERFSQHLRATKASVLILCESDDELFRRSLSLDTADAEQRLSFRELRFRRDLFHELADNFTAAAKERIDIRNAYAPLTLNLARFDSRFYCVPVVDTLADADLYEEIDERHPWHRSVVHYEEYLRAGYGARFTAARDAEVIELYDQERAPRGLFPRGCFYDTDYHQYVIWDFIFDRAGNLLIHQRAQNAKDNRGMWDKSVGGHVDWSRELTSARTAVRELIEELFEDELNKESMAHFTESEANVIYMGDWRPDKRGRRPLEEIRGFKGNEWAYFSLRDQLQLDTPRYFTDRVKRLRVIADIYLFIANRDLRVENLKNSQFRLVRVTDLKSEIDRSPALEPGASSTSGFLASPDLRYVMSGPLREVLEEVSQAVRFVFGG